MLARQMSACEIGLIWRFEGRPKRWVVGYDRCVSCSGTRRQSCGGNGDRSTVLGLESGVHTLAIVVRRSWASRMVDRDTARCRSAVTGSACVANIAGVTAPFAEKENGKECRCSSVLYRDVVQPVKFRIHVFAKPTPDRVYVDGGVAASRRGSSRAWPDV